MNFLKNFSVGIISFVLFLALTVFGLAYSLNSTLLNPKFINSTIDSINVTDMIRSVSDSSLLGQSGSNTPQQQYMLDTLGSAEPVIKQGLNTGISSIYDYLLGHRNQPQLDTALRDSFMNQTFTANLLKTVDFSRMINVYSADITSAGSGQITPDTVKAIEATVKDIQPSLKDKLAAASDPVYAYLLGQTNSLDLAGTLRKTVLTSSTIQPILNSLATDPTVLKALDDAIIQQLPSNLTFLSGIVDSLTPKIMPLVTQQLDNNTDNLLNYLLGSSNSLQMTISLTDIKQTITQTVKDDASQIPPAELTQFVKPIVISQISTMIPSSLAPYVTQAVTDQWITDQLTANYQPLMDYLTGKSQTVDITVDLQPVITAAKDAYKTAFLQSPPSPFNLLPQSQLSAAFDTLYSTLAPSIPTTMKIDQTMLAGLPQQFDQLINSFVGVLPNSMDIGNIVAAALPAQTVTNALDTAQTNLATVKTDIANGIANAQTPLSEAKTYVSSFRMYYTLLLIFMLALVALIILILRDVRRISRTLGVPLMMYGLVELIGTIVITKIAPNFIPTQNLPASIRSTALGLMSDVVHPAVVFSIALFVIGLVLILVSVFYRRGAEAD